MFNGEIAGNAVRAGGDGATAGECEDSHKVRIRGDDIPCSCVQAPSRSSALHHHGTVTLVWCTERMHTVCGPCTTLHTSRLHLTPLANRDLHAHVFEPWKKKSVRNADSVAQGTRRNNVPKPDFAGGVVISSGAVLGDLRDFEALKIGKQLELVWGSLGLMPGRNRSARNDNWISLRISWQASGGVRHEADTDTFFALHKMQTNSPGDALSDTRKDNGRVLATRSAVPVSGSH